jgi:iron(III) transport system permease protein
MVASSVPRSARTWEWALGLALLAVPGPVVGAGLVAAWGSSAFEALYDSPAVLVAAALARYLPIATLLVAAASARVGGDTADAAAVAVPPLAAFRHAVLPGLAPAAVLGGLAVAALAAGEISASLMVVPPGFGTVATRMYNLLHYGASPDVAGLALATAAAEIALVAAGVAIATRLSLRGRSS